MKEIWIKEIVVSGKELVQFPFYETYPVTYSVL